jgi:hypothetical protein
VLRSLGLKRNGKTGTAALPVALSGQADFQWTWAGSLANPRIAGNLKATELAISKCRLEFPGRPGPRTVRGRPVRPPRFGRRRRQLLSHAHRHRARPAAARRHPKLALSGTLAAAPETHAQQTSGI